MCSLSQNKKAKKKTVCPKDMKTCPDGTRVGRTGRKCRFKCPGQGSKKKAKKASKKAKKASKKAKKVKKKVRDGSVLARSCPGGRACI